MNKKFMILGYEMKDKIRFIKNQSLINHSWYWLNLIVFRPSVAHTNFIEFDKETKRQMTLESFSVDDDLMLYIESNRVVRLYFIKF